MFCNNCGAEIKDSAAFCPKCGAPVKKAAQPMKATSQPMKATSQPTEVASRPAAQQSVNGYEPQGNSQGAAQKTAQGGSKNLLIMLGAFLGVLLLAGLGVGIFFVASGRDKDGNEAVEATDDQTQEAETPEKVTSDTQEAASDTIPSDVPTTAQGEESAAQDGDSSVSYAAYQDILNEIHDGIIILYDEGFGSDNLPDAHFGSWDCIYNQYGFGTAEEALDSVGYTLQDFDGDGVDELVVGLPSGDILELYTLQNGAAAPLLLRSGYREVYWLAEDNIIYNQGSNGAAAGGIAAYHVTGNGVELIEGYDWDFAFSTENSVTHKTGGILSPGYGSVEGAQTEMLTMDEDTFYDEISNSFFALQAKELELTPFSSL